jgi:hypothetical protein
MESALHLRGRRPRDRPGTEAAPAVRKEIERRFTSTTGGPAAI